MRGDGPECLVDRGAICDTPPPCGGRQGRRGERGQDLTRPCCPLATTSQSSRVTYQLEYTMSMHTYIRMYVLQEYATWNAQYARTLHRVHHLYTAKNKNKSFLNSCSYSSTLVPLRHKTNAGIVTSLVCILATLEEQYYEYARTLVCIQSMQTYSRVLLASMHFMHMHTVYLAAVCILANTTLAGVCMLLVFELCVQYAYYQRVCIREYSRSTLRAQLVCQYSSYYTPTLVQTQYIIMHNMHNIILYTSYARSIYNVRARINK